MRLPVSGFDVSFRLPDGYDDLSILEAGGDSPGATIERAVDALCRLATLTSAASLTDTEAAPAPVPSQWTSFTVTDFEYALLGLRRFLFGDTVRCLFRCTCSERMEIEFSIATLLREAYPRTPRRVVPSTTRAGWFFLPDKRATFRLPVIADQLQALHSATPFALLEQRCIESPAEFAHPDRRHEHRVRSAVERAMETMAPAVSRPIAGVCAACGEQLSRQLHVPSLVLDELRSSATGVYGEIHAIAATYHWQESAILSLPQLRRHAYTDAIRHGYQVHGMTIQEGVL